MKPKDGGTGKNNRQQFSIGARIQSMRHAVNGIGFILKTQHNARVQLAVAMLVILAAWSLQLGAHDWRWLILAIALVWSAEAVNTAIEYVCDIVSPQFHPTVRLAKDIGAAAVLIAIGGAGIIGVITFWPYLFG